MQKQLKNQLMLPLLWELEHFPIPKHVPINNTIFWCFKIYIGQTTFNGYKI